LGLADFREIRNIQAFELVEGEGIGMTSDASQTIFPSVPLPLGAHFREDSVTFTVFSRHAERVWLMFFKEAQDAEPAAEYELAPESHRFGDLWHIRLPRPLPGRFYLYRMAGPRDQARGLFDPQQWLLDPYARAIAGSPRWGETLGLPPGQRPSQGALFPKCVLVEDDYDWGGDRPPRIPLAETIIYELHVRGYTVHPSSGVKRPGTYAGLIEKLPYIRKLGVTTIELLPVHEFDEMEYYRTGDPRQGLRNFWGYSTVAFFAPNGRYAAAGVTGGQVNEFRDLVRAAHAHGLEIILDVVFNHTAEGGEGGPVWSFKGIDNSIYYLLDGKGRYRNFSGCGNTFNCNHPVVQDFIVDCLRYWVTEMHVDGFRFDLASVLTRGTDGRPLENPPLIERISEDPVLRDCKLIAEAWDAAGLYQVGSFPGKRWSEWNGRFRDDVRRFWKGDPGTLPLLFNRVAGSPDLYLKAGGTPLKSVNYVASHDGFTLHDLTAYNHKHNEANCEQNRDGESHNHSFNFGVEGPTDDPAVLALRRQQQKNLIATVLTSLGVPMILAGDEFGRTQQGNNNAYCQDNELSWVDWTLAETNRDLLEFVRAAIRLRRQSPLLRFASFPRPYHKDSPVRVEWLGPSGDKADPGRDRACSCLLAWVSPPRKGPAAHCLVYNPTNAPVTFRLPPAPVGAWRIVLHSQQDDQPALQPDGALDTGPHSFVVLDCRAG